MVIVYSVTIAWLAALSMQSANATGLVVKPGAQSCPFFKPLPPPPGKPGKLERLGHGPINPPSPPINAATSGEIAVSLVMSSQCEVATPMRQSRLD